MLSLFTIRGPGLPHSCREGGAGLVPVGGGVQPGRPRPQSCGTRGAWAGVARRIEGREPAPPEVAAPFRVPGLWRDGRGPAMEQPELEAISDDAMDSFLEKFQNQPYRGGFNEDQWEEVGRPRGAARAWGVLRTRAPGAEAPPSVPDPLRY